MPAGLILVGCQNPPAAPTKSAPQVQAVAPPPPPPNPDDQAVATMGDLAVTRGQLDAKLKEADGLNMLVELMELAVAKSQAAQANIVVTDADISQETQRYVGDIFKDDRQLQNTRDQIADLERAGKTDQANVVRQDLANDMARLLDQLLQNQKVTHTDFGIAMETVTYLRKIAEPQVGKRISEENLETAFNAIYGEKLRVRHIALANLQEVNEAKRRLAEGRPFDEVAREMSRNNQTAPLGGELPPFTRDTPGFPQAFKDTAFALKVGEISDPVEADGVYHLIKLEDRIPPTAIKFEDVKDAVRQTLYDKLLDQTVKLMRNQIQQHVLAVLKNSDPVLASQFHDKMAAQEEQAHDRDAVRRELARTRPEAATGPAWKLLPPTTAPMGESPESGEPMPESQGSEPTSPPAQAQPAPAATSTPPAAQPPPAPVRIPSTAPAAVPATGH